MVYGGEVGVVVVVFERVGVGRAVADAEPVETASARAARAARPAGGRRDGLGGHRPGRGERRRRGQALIRGNAIRWMGFAT